MKIIWTELAVEKLEEFADYIEKDKPNAASNWVKKILSAVNKLKKFSKIGRIVQEINRNNIREILEGNYRIIYKVESNQISILTIRHCSQLLGNKDIYKTN